MSPSVLVVIVAALVLGGVVQGATGSGFGVVTAPVLLALAPSLVPGPLLIVATVVCGAGAWRERARIDRRFALRCVAAAVPGTAAGLLLCRCVDAEVMMIGIATIVVAAGCIGFTGVRMPTGRRSAVAAGFCCGALNFTAALPGPPLTLTYRTADVAQMRATLSAVFAVLSAGTAAMIIAAGGGIVGDVRAAAVLGLPVAVGVVLSRGVGHRLGAQAIARVGTGLSVLAGIGLLLTHV